MFRSRRRNFVTQLWKSRIDRGPSRPTADDPAATEDDQDRCCWTRRRRRDLDQSWDTSDTPRHPSTSAGQRDPSPAGVDGGKMVRKSDAMSVLDRLGLSELELLLEVVQGAGHQVSGCIPAPVKPLEDVPSRYRCPAPHLLCWLLYRWTPLDSSEGYRDVETSELKRMPGCAGEMEGNVCCNPYHWSRVAASVTDIIRSRRPSDSNVSYSSVVDAQLLKPQVISSSSQGASNSLSTDDDDAAKSWCTVAYWELRHRVGPLYVVRQPYVDVFSELALGSGLCLSQLHSTATHVDTGVLRARRKIGAGLVLSREPDGVWVYNRSQFPIFVGRPLPSSLSPTSTVDRLPPGFCLRVTDAEDDHWKPACPVDGPCNRHSLQISFGKGFGTDRYSRRTVHSCPCWIEILLRVT